MFNLRPGNDNNQVNIQHNIETLMNKIGCSYDEFTCMGANEREARLMQLISKSKQLSIGAPGAAGALTQPPYSVLVHLVVALLYLYDTMNSPKRAQVLDLPMNDTAFMDSSRRLLQSSHNDVTNALTSFNDTSYKPRETLDGRVAFDLKMKMDEIERFVLKTGRDLQEEDTNFRNRLAFQFITGEGAVLPQLTIDETKRLLKEGSFDDLVDALRTDEQLLLKVSQTESLQEFNQKIQRRLEVIWSLIKYKALATAKSAFNTLERKGATAAEMYQFAEEVESMSLRFMMSVRK